MYLFPLSTTGSLDFHSLITSTHNPPHFDIHALAATRAALRQALKDSKHIAVDYAALLAATNAYLPHLHALHAALAADTVVFTADPLFSWRPTLSSASNPPRVPFHALSAEITFAHLSHAQATSNIATSLVDSLGAYEHRAHLADIERKAMDERLNTAVSSLCAAAGEFAYLAQLNPEPTPGPKSPPDLSKDALTALSKMTLADAQLLAIRKLLSKSTNDSALIPGPPLPKSHPSPILIAKLYLEASALFNTARGLVTTSASSSLKLKRDEGQVSSSLRQYLTQMQTLASLLAHQWLGVDAGEQGHLGEAVGFLLWAQEELQSIDADYGERKKIKKQLEAFLAGYRKDNDSIYFQPVLTREELRAKVPSGRAAVAIKPYQVPQPVTGMEPDGQSAEQPSNSATGNERYF